MRTPTHLAFKTAICPSLKQPRSARTGGASNRRKPGALHPIQRDELNLQCRSPGPGVLSTSRPLVPHPSGVRERLPILDLRGDEFGSGPVVAPVKDGEVVVLGA